MRTAFVLKSKMDGQIYGRAFECGEADPLVWLQREVRWVRNYKVLHHEPAGPQAMCCDTWAREWAERREAQAAFDADTPFLVGKVYKTEEGSLRKVLSIDPKKGIRTAEWSVNRREWSVPDVDFFPRGLDGKWKWGRGDALTAVECRDPESCYVATARMLGDAVGEIVKGEDGQIKSISITSAGSGYRGRPGIHDSVVIDEVIDSAGFALEDPSARRDREHVAVARIDERTPYAHHPDLAGWTMDSSTSTRDFGILHKTEVLE